MKKKLQILFASLVALCSLGTASAQTWTALPVAAGDGYLLYNVGSGQFFTKGNGWGTQASITTDANPASAVPVELIAVGTDWFLRTGVNNHDYGLEHLSGGTCYTDQSRNKQSTWTFTNVADDNGPVYTILSADNHGGGAGKYLAANSENTIVGPSDDAESPYARWKLITKGFIDFKALVEEVEVIKAQASRSSAATDDLNNTIFLAGLAVAAAPGDATVVNNAINGVRNALTTYLSESGATAASGIDVTDFWITNPTPVASSTGWTIVNGTKGNDWAGNTYDAANNCAEFWQWAGSTIKQNLTNLPAGAYKLVAQAFTRTGMVGTLYAGTESMSIATIGSDVANSRGQAKTWFDAGNGFNELPFTLSAAGDVEIGITTDNTTADYWTVWRGFKLIYYGEGAINASDVAAGTYYLYNVGARQYLENGANWGTHAIVSNVGLDCTISAVGTDWNIKTGIGSGNLFCDATDAWTDGGGANEGFAWTFTQVTTSGGAKAYTIENAGKFLTADASGKVMVGTDNTIDNAFWMLVTPDDRLAAALVEFPSASESNPIDISFLIKGGRIATMDDTRNGAWVGDKAFGGYRDANFGDMNVEKWHSAATDINQVISNLPEGMYKVGAVGFVRYDGDTSIPSVLYANNKTVDLPNITSGASATKLYDPGDWQGDATVAEGFVPNSQAGAAFYFNAGQYAEVTTIVPVIAGQNLQLGVKTTSGTNWTVADRFSLAYTGPLSDPMLNAPAFVPAPGSTMAVEEYQGVNVSFPEFFAGAADPNALQYTYTAVLSDNEKGIIDIEVVTDKPANARDLFTTVNVEEARIYTVTIIGTSMTDGTDTWTDTNVYNTSWIIPAASEIETGVYYIQNRGAGTYIVGANDWGTRASLAAHAIDLNITNVGGAYQINSGISNGNNSQFLGHGLFVDSNPEDWTFTKVGASAYTISYNDNGTEKYLVAASTAAGAVINTTNDPMDEMAQWFIISKQDYIDNIAAAGYGDLTPLVLDWDFGRNNTRKPAWQGNPAIGGDNANMCAEKYNTTFDVYQIVEGLPEGRYQVRAQAFYRDGYPGDAAAARNAGTEAHIAYLYAQGVNEVSQPVMSIFDDAPSAQDGNNGFNTQAGGWYVPNSMNEASAAFKAGKYKNTMVEEVVVDGSGQLRIGIKKDVKGRNGDWAIFDTFELQYLGNYDETNSAPLAAGTYRIRNNATGQYLYAGGADGNDLTTYNEGLVFTVSKTGANEYYLSTNIGPDADHCYVGLTTDEFSVTHLTFGLSATDKARFNIGLGGFGASRTIQAADGNYLVDASSTFGIMGNVVAFSPVPIFDGTDRWYFEPVADNNNDLTYRIADWGFDINNLEADAWKGNTKVGGKTYNQVGYAKGKNFNAYQEIEGLEEGYYLIYAQVVTPDGTDPVYLYATTSNGTKSRLVPVNASINAASKASAYFGNNSYWTTEVAIYNNGGATSATYEVEGAVSVGADGKLTIGVRKENGTTESTVYFDNFVLNRYSYIEKTQFISLPTSSNIFLAGHHVETIGGVKTVVDDKTDITDIAIGDPNKFHINADGYPEITLNTNDSIANGLELTYLGANIRYESKSNYRLYATITDKVGNVYHFEADGMKLPTSTAWGNKDYALFLAPGFFGPNEEYTIHLDRVEYIDFTQFNPITCDPDVLYTDYVDQTIIIKTGAGVTQNPEAVGIRQQLVSVDYVENFETGINGLSAAEGQQMIFNLAGQRVSKAQKGIYVINGKKVVVK